MHGVSHMAPLWLTIYIICLHNAYEQLNIMLLGTAIGSVRSGSHIISADEPLWDTLSRTMLMTIAIYVFEESHSGEAHNQQESNDQSI